MCMTIHGNPCLALGLGGWLGQTLHGLHGLHGLGWLLEEHACERTTNSFFVSLDGLHCLHGFECLHGLHGRLGLGLCSHMHGKAQFKKKTRTTTSLTNMLYMAGICCPTVPCCPWWSSWAWPSSKRLAWTCTWTNWFNMAFMALDFMATMAWEVWAFQHKCSLDCWSSCRTQSAIKSNGKCIQWHGST